MTLSAEDVILVTGATGLVGSHVVEQAHSRGLGVRALVRPSSDTSFLQSLGIEWVSGGMTEPYSLRAALRGVTHVVHCAAMVGDWGPPQRYRQVNVEGLESLLDEASQVESLQRLVHISSLGVYPARHHHGTKETAEVSTQGIDGYTQSKIEAEKVVRRAIKREGLPAVILRPGFIYGPRDRTVLPRIVERLQDGRFAYIGEGDQRLNNTYVGNLVDAVSLSLERDGVEGQTFHITDGRLVTRLELIETIVRLGNLPKPKRQIPLGVANVLAPVMEWGWKLLGQEEAPLLSRARVKFLGLNLDFSIDKAREQLGYNPRIDFTDGMQATMDWFRERRLV